MAKSQFAFFHTFVTNILCSLALPPTHEHILIEWVIPHYFRNFFQKHYWYLINTITLYMHMYIIFSTVLHRAVDTANRHTHHSLSGWGRDCHAEVEDDFKGFWSAVRKCISTCYYGNVSITQCTWQCMGILKGTAQCHLIIVCDTKLRWESI